MLEESVLMCPGRQRFCITLSVGIAPALGCRKIIVEPSEHTSGI